MPSSTQQRSEYRKQFINELRAVSQSYSLQDVFKDACRCMAISLVQPTLEFDKKQRASLESEYMSYAEKYGKTGMEHIANAFTAVVNALELRREDFLGSIMEEIGASNQRGTAQFLTPEPVAKLMARCTMPDLNGHKPGEIVTINDPACGASVTLIEGAEEFIQAGGRQADIVLHAQDLDFNAFNISYIQLTLLGYAATVTRQDTLAGQIYEGPWITMGYVMHGILMRTMSAGQTQKEGSESRERVVAQEAQEAAAEASERADGSSCDHSEETATTAHAYALRGVQMELWI